MEGGKGECDCRYTHLAGGDNVYKDPAGWRIVFKATFSCYSQPQRTKRKLLALPDFWRCRVFKSFLHRERASEHSSCYPNCRADILAPAGTSWCKLASPPENLWRNFVSLLRKKNNKKKECWDRNSPPWLAVGSSPLRPEMLLRGGKIGVCKLHGMKSSCPAALTMSGIFELFPAWVFAACMPGTN